MLVFSIPYPNAPYAETGVVGNSLDFSAAYSMSNNEVGVYSVTVPTGGVWVKKVHLEIYDTTSGNKFKPVLYTGTGTTATLVKVGQELVFPTTLVSTNTEYSVDWNSDGSAYFIAAGTYGLGYLTSGNSNVRSKSNGEVRWKANTYSSGPVSPLGTTSQSLRDPAIWMPYSVSGP